MIIKLEKIIHCSSEHPSYPASNLLQYRLNTSWRCAKPGEMLATVIFQLAQPSCITGLDIGNYRSCVVIVTASATKDPDNWVPIVNYQFLTHEEAADGKFKDQVQLFTKKDLNPEILEMQFDRVKVTCMQSANLKELFGLSFFVLRTEVKVDTGLDAFGRFKMKTTDENFKTPVEQFKEKYMKFMNEKKADYKKELQAKVKEAEKNNFLKRQEENREPPKRPLLEKLEAGLSDEVFGKQKKITDASPSTFTKKNDSLKNEVNNAETSNNKPVARTPFGDVIPSTSKESNQNNVKNEKKETNHDKKIIKTERKDSKDLKQDTSTRKRTLSSDENSPEKADEKTIKRKQQCPDCNKLSDDEVCKICGKLPVPKPNTSNIIKKKDKKLTKPFEKLFDDIIFSLSGYVNPQRDEIRKKALKMGAKYLADPNARNKCTHLICAFRNTPKYHQLKDISKIVSHKFIEDCFNEKKRFSWRHYALDINDRHEPESEEEIIGSVSPLSLSDIYDEDTDPDSS